MHRLLAGSLTLLSLAVAGRVQAEAACGWSPASWNAPNGAVVFNHGPGPIRDVLSAVGEFRTHSMLSHGPGGGVTHATMRIPDKNPWPAVCSLPLNANQLQYGYPGLEQVNQGGIYAFLYGASGGTEWIGYQLGDPAAAAQIADTIWNNYPYVVDAARGDPGMELRRPIRNSARVNYSLFQYRNLETAHQVPGGSANNGIVCSTFLAFAHNTAGRGWISPYRYLHDFLASAASSVYLGTYNACRASLGWFESQALGVICPFNNVCGNAGSQVANCMSTNSCAVSGPGLWTGVRDNPGTTAISISPDRIGGWGVHPWNLTTWSPDYTHDLQWNSGGNVYGCWE